MPAQVYSHLLTHESRLSHQLTTLIASPDLFANLTFKPSSDQSNKGHGTFYGRGNYKGQGKGRNGGNGGRNSSFSSSYFPSNRPQCQVCFKISHTALICHHCFNQSYQAPPPPSLSAHYTSDPPPHSSPASFVDANWYSDTAATNHFTHDHANLTLNPTEYRGDE